MLGAHGISRLLNKHSNRRKSRICLSEDINTEITHMELCNNQKSVKSKCILVFKVATLCLDDSLAHTWNSLNQLHEVVTWNAFKQVSLVKS